MHVRKWTHLGPAGDPLPVLRGGDCGGRVGPRMAGVDKIMADLGASPFGSDGPGLSGDGSCETNRHCHSSEFDRTGLRRL